MTPTKQTVFDQVDAYLRDHLEIPKLLEAVDYFLTIDAIYQRALRAMHPRMSITDSTNPLPEPPK